MMIRLGDFLNVFQKLFLKSFKNGQFFEAFWPKSLKTGIAPDWLGAVYE